MSMENVQKAIEKIRIGKYMIAFLVEQKLKTSIYSINNITHGDVLGIVKWHSAWRQYCFFITSDIILSSGCMVNLQEFLNDLNEKQKKNINLCHYTKKK